MTRIGFLNATRMRTALASVLRTGASHLFRHPRLAVICLALLVLGLASHTVFFSVFSTVLLRPLPMPAAHRLVLITDSISREVSPVAFLALRDKANSYATIAAYSYQNQSLSQGGTPLYTTTAVVTPAFFDVLGQRPHLGTAFSAGAEPGSLSGRVVLGFSLWRSMFGSRGDVVGRTVSLDGAPFVVIGVMGPDCLLPENASLWITSGADPVPRWLFASPDRDSATSTETYLGVLGRLRPGVSVESARHELSTLSEQIRSLQRRPEPNWCLLLTPLRESLFGSARRVSSLLLAAVSVLLAMVLLNVATLQLVQEVTDTQSVGTKLALGATGARLAGEVFVRTALMGLGATALASGLSLGLMGLVRRFLAPGLRGGDYLRLHPSDLLYMFLVALLLSVAVASAVGLYLDRTHLAAVLRTPRLGLRLRPPWLREAVLALQVASGLPLLLGSATLLRGIDALTNAPLGFAPTDVIVFRLPLSPDRVRRMPGVLLAHQRLLEEIGQWPELSAAGFTSVLPLGGGEARSQIRIASTLGRSREPLDVSLRFVNHGYFRALGIPLVLGRVFGPSDRQGEACVALIDDVASRRYWRSSEPLGDGIFVPPHLRTPCRIVGVVGSIRSATLDTDPSPTVYLLLEQAAGPLVEAWARQMTYVIRTNVPVDDFAERIDRAVRTLDGAQAIADLSKMPRVVDAALGPRRPIALFLLAFGGVALALALGGAFALSSHAAAGRRTELAVRVALGATAPQVIRAALSSAAATAALGVGLGAALYLVFGSALRSLVYGSGYAPPGLILAVSGATFLAIVGASAVPLLALRRPDLGSLLRDA